MGGRQNPYILANCFESFIGAIFLDAGFTAAFKFIRLHVYGMLDEILQKNLHIDPKTALQEWSQAHYGVTPEYLLLEESGADHNKIYTVQVQISDKKY